MWWVHGLNLESLKETFLFFFFFLGRSSTWDLSGTGNAAIVEILGHPAAQIRKQQLSHEESIAAPGTNFRGDDASQSQVPPPADRPWRDSIEQVQRREVRVKKGANNRDVLRTDHSTVRRAKKTNMRHTCRPLFHIPLTMAIGRMDVGWYAMDKAARASDIFVHSASLRVETWDHDRGSLTVALLFVFSNYCLTMN